MLSRRAFLQGILTWGAATIPALAPQAESPEYFVTSANYQELPPDCYYPERITPREIILHYDANSQDKSLWVVAITYETLQRNGLSVHFAVDYKRVWQMLPMYRTQVQMSKGAQGFNATAINIEMAGTRFDEPDFYPPESEVQLTLFLVSVLMDFYRIPFENVVGHFERDLRGLKQDPGVRFMASFRQQLAAYRRTLTPTKRWLNASG